MPTIARRHSMAWRAGIAVLAMLLAGLASSWWIRARQANEPLARARAAYERRDWQTARASALERLKGAPEDLEALRLLARSAARLERDDLARSIYQDRIGMERMTGEDFYLIAAGLFRQRRFATAWTAMEQGLRLDPHQPELLQGLASLEAWQDKLAEALKRAEPVTVMRGWEARGHLLIGSFRAELPDPAAAAESFERALKLDPTLRGATESPDQVRKQLARAWLQAGQASRARRALKPVLDRGRDPEAFWLLSRVELQEENVPGASAALERSPLQEGHEGTRFDREPAPFVGAAKCAQCHADIHRSQQNSLHARTFFRTVDLSKIDLPRAPVTDSSTKEVTHALRRNGDQTRVETRVGTEVYQAVVDYAVGSGDRGLSLIGHDAAGHIRELRVSKYNDGSGWDRTTGHSEKPEDHADYLGLSLTEDALRRCLHCHTTDGYRAVTAAGPTVLDRGIGCERCHGPGGHHIQAVAAKFADLAIARPQYFPVAKQVKMCGECHSPRNVKLDDTSNALNTRFQASTFVKSRCFTEGSGSFSCLTCHNPHRDAVAAASFYEPKCLSCHALGSRPDPGPTRAPSCPVNPRNRCLECHMPAIKGATAHSSFTDHHIRVHREAGS